MAEGDKKLNVKHLINLLLEEPKIHETIKAGLKKEARDYNNCMVDLDNHRIYFGKYGWTGFSGFWNNLIKCCDHISFDDFFVKAWDALVAMTVGMPAHEAVLEGLSRETLLGAIHKKEYDRIADRFFDVCRHLTNDGYWKTQGTKTNLNSKVSSHHFNGCPYSGEVEIEVAPKGPAQKLHVVDMLGDVFEIINVRWTGGRRN